MNPPIIIVRERPLTFGWYQTTTTPIGERKVYYEGAIGPTVDEALADMITLAQNLIKEKAEKQALLDRWQQAVGMTLEQAETNAKAEKPTITNVTNTKAKSK